MLWFRTRRSVLTRLACALWLLGFALVASQACLIQPSHDLATAHDTANYDPSHAQHASGCLQYCADRASALSPAADRAEPAPVMWAVLLLLPALASCSPLPSALAWLVLRRPAPPRPPARLRFVRLND